MEARVQQAWGFVQRCQTTAPEDLLTVLRRAGFFPEDDQAESSENRSTKRSGKQGLKWQTDHRKFAEKQELTQQDLQPFSALREVSHLTAREADLLVLKAAALCKKKGTSSLQGLYCMAIGESVRRAKLSQSHPCLLPTKKYIYLLHGKVIKGNDTASKWFALQGLGLKELQLCGLAEVITREAQKKDLQLTAKQAQDLAGNAFTTTLLSAVMLGVALADH